MPAQITVLLALTAKLFDPVPMDQMKDAAQAVQTAAATIPTEVGARFETADKLNDDDGKTIIEIARKSLARFLPKPEVQARSQTNLSWRRIPKTKARHPVHNSDRAGAEARNKPKLFKACPQVRSGAQGGVYRAIQPRVCAERLSVPGDLQSVVRTMKALAALSIGQYEKIGACIG